MRLQRLGSREVSRLYVASGNSSEHCSEELRREAVWTDNLAQVMQWAAGVDTLGPDDHGLALSIPTTLDRGNSGVEVSMTNHQSWPAACLYAEGAVPFLAP